MAEKELKAALDKLNGELQKLDPNDTESREMLRQLLASIQQKLEEPANTEHHQDLLETLKEKATYFKAEHPVIGGALEDVIDILVKMGI